MGTRVEGYVKLTDTSIYPNLAIAEGKVLRCLIEDIGDGDKMYHVYPSTLEEVGCIVGTCRCAYPFYANEVLDLTNKEITNE